MSVFACVLSGAIFAGDDDQDLKQYYGSDHNFVNSDASFKGQSKGDSRYAYQIKTDKDFEDGVHPYFEHVKKLSNYFKTKHQKNTDHEEMTLWNYIEGIESYSPKETKVQKWDPFYTGVLSYKVTGVRGNDDLSGSKHGLNVKKELTKQGREAFIIAAIHAGFNASTYQASDTTAGNFYTNPANIQLNQSSQDDQKKIKRHRLAFQAFKNLMVAIENRLSTSKFGNNLCNIGANQWPRIFKKDEITDDVYKVAVNNVIDHFGWDYSEKNDLAYRTEDLSKKVNLQDCLLSFKETFIKLFLGVTSINNDRMWGIVRKPYIDEEEKAEIERLANAAANDPDAPKAADFGVVKDNLEEIELKVNVSVGSLNQVTFSNLGGAHVTKEQIKRNGNAEDGLEGVIVPFLRVTDLKKRDNDVLKAILHGKREYLLIRGKNLTVEEAKKKQDLLNSGKLIVFSTDKPDKDGVLAYFGDGGVQMIARPHEDLQSSKFVESGGGLKLVLNPDAKTFGKALFDFRKGNQSAADIGKIDYTFPTKSDEANLAVDIPNKDDVAAKCGVAGKGFCGHQARVLKKDGYYLWAYKTNNKDEDDILFMKNDPKINGLDLESISKEGFFWNYDNALFYVKNNKKIGKNEKTEIFAINAASKEVIKDIANFNKIIKDSLNPILARYKKEA